MVFLTYMKIVLLLIHITMNNPYGYDSKNYYPGKKDKPIKNHFNRKYKQKKHPFAGGCFFKLLIQLTAPYRSSLVFKVNISGIV